MTRNSIYGKKKKKKHAGFLPMPAPWQDQQLLQDKCNEVSVAKRFLLFFFMILYPASELILGNG